jgi:predicted dehydrogenase
MVGVNTTHAGAFARILNEQRALPGATVTWVWGGELRPGLPDAAGLAERYDIADVATGTTEFLTATDLVLILDDTGGGASHVGLARPFVEAGVPTFIDKPMSTDLREARALFALAAARGTPLTSSSALRFAAETAAARDRITGLGPISSVVSVSPGEWFYYGIHAVEQLYAAIGPGVEWVQRFTWPDRDITVLSYHAGHAAVVQTLRDAARCYMVTLYGKHGWLTVDNADGEAFYRGQLAAAVEMARTGRPPVAPDETLELLAVLQAGVLSAERGGERVAVAQVLASTD